MKQHILITKYAGDVGKIHYIHSYIVSLLFLFKSISQLVTGIQKLLNYFDMSLSAFWNKIPSSHANRYDELLSNFVHHYSFLALFLLI